jgi:hypothetical protein
MKRMSLVVLIVLASLVLTIQPSAAGPVTMNLAVLGGGGVLSDSSTFSVQGMSLTVTNPGHPVSQSFGNLVLNGVHTHCTLTSADCSVSPATASLSCADASTHTVTAGVSGSTLGALDTNDVTAGFVFMQCISH